MRSLRATTATALPDRRFAALASLLAALLLATVLGPSPASGTDRTFIVPAGAALPSGTEVLERLAVVDALLVTAPTAPLGSVPAETPLAFKSLAVAAAEGEDLDSGVASTGAEEVWSGGNRGEGSVVALIDSGVTAIPALEDALVAELDFAGSGLGDPLGHGTFMASLIAARGTVAPGVAPAADILSLKVGDEEGGTTLITVLRALDWLHGPGRTLGIRIGVLALGIDPDSRAAQLLDQATDRLAQGDVLVVTAAGNDGSGELTSPATAARTFSVGAYDPVAQADSAAPVAADFSGSGPDRRGVQQPDILAAGVSVLSHIPADSIIGLEHAVNDAGTLVRGSGTSMSTALAAGVAALAHGARPDLGGGALDTALRTDAGVLDAPVTLAAVLDAPGEPGRPAARGGRSGNAGPPPGREAKSPQDVRWENIRWKDVQWTNIRWKGQAWANIRWKGGHWTGVDLTAADWENIRWKDEAWANIRWKGEGWTNIRWKDGGWTNIRWKDRAWTNIRWKDEAWANIRWKDDAWTNIRWKDDAWTNMRWKSDSWTMLEAP